MSVSACMSVCIIRVSHSLGCGVCGMWGDKNRQSGGSLGEFRGGQGTGKGKEVHIPCTYHPNTTHRRAHKQYNPHIHTDTRDTLKEPRTLTKIGTHKPTHTPKKHRHPYTLSYPVTHTQSDTHKHTNTHTDTQTQTHTLYIP